MRLSEESPTGNDAIRALVRRYGLIERRPVVLLLGAAALAAALGVSIPLSLSWYVRRAEDSSTLGVLLLAAGFFIVLSSLNAALSIAIERVGERLAWSGTNALRYDLTVKALERRPDGDSSESATVLVDRVEGDASRLERMFSQLFVQLLVSLGLAAGMVVVVGIVDVVIGMAVLGYVAVALSMEQKRQSAS